MYNDKGKLEYRQKGRARELSYEEKKKDLDYAVRTAAIKEATDTLRKARLRNLHLMLV